jgi:hypothetical protein
MWRAPRARVFGWMVPVAAAWIFSLTYLILHVFLGVPVNRIVSPYLAFCALTLAMQLALFWALRYGARIKSTIPAMSVLVVYGLLFFPVWVHFALSLGIGKPKAVVGGAWIGGSIWCLGFVPLLVRRQQVRR